MKPIHQEIFEKAKPCLRTRKNLIHTRIALRYALELLQSEQGDEDIVIPAVLLHDVGWKTIPEELHLTAFGPNPSNPKLTKVHEIEGAKMAEAILSKHQYPPKKIKEICQIIRGHDTRKRAISVNDHIVKDADKLWRYSRKGIAIDLGRFHVKPVPYLDYLEKVINQWFLTSTAREIAKKEIKKRRIEHFIRIIRK
ncbi:MAG: HD domain-containing protein [Deltaproteobacteria bacterium]|nr:HD domain-containing protein [Deltaproteobacteria bacterium]